MITSIEFIAVGACALVVGGILLLSISDSGAFARLSLANTPFGRAIGELFQELREGAIVTWHQILEEVCSKVVTGLIFVAVYPLLATPHVVEFILYKVSAFLLGTRSKDE